jgi:hypothetical protein
MILHIDEKTYHIDEAALTGWLLARYREAEQNDPRLRRGSVSRLGLKGAMQTLIMPLLKDISVKLGRDLPKREKEQDFLDYAVMQSLGALHAVGSQAELTARLHWHSETQATITHFVPNSEKGDIATHADQVVDGGRAQYRASLAPVATTEE